MRSESVLYIRPSEKHAPSHCRGRSSDFADREYLQSNAKKKRNEQRMYKNVSICLLDLPATPKVSNVRLGEMYLWRHSRLAEMKYSYIKVMQTESMNSGLYQIMGKPESREMPKFLAYETNSLNSLSRSSSAGWSRHSYSRLRCHVIQNIDTATRHERKPVPPRVVLRQNRNTTTALHSPGFEPEAPTPKYGHSGR